MAEFAITIPIFLLAFVLIIEVSRFMWAIITINQAAQTAARYAVTGEVMDRYRGEDNAEDHWDPTSSQPDARILPCRPILHDPGGIPDPVVAELNAAGAYNHTIFLIEDFHNNPPADSIEGEIANLYQPYRSGRECSVEQAAISQMRTLPLNPDASEDEAGFYHIVISGYSDDISPTEGEFNREGDPNNPVQYDWYYGEFFLFDGEGEDLAACYDAGGTRLEGIESREECLGTDGNQWLNYNAGFASGFAGEPNDAVQIHIDYNLPILTPLLNGVVEYITINGLATLTNEAFGNTGLNREAIQPPNIPDVPGIDDFFILSPGSINPDQPRIVGPINGQLVQTGAPSLVWVGLPDALAYQLQVYEASAYDDVSESFILAPIINETLVVGEGDDDEVACTDPETRPLTETDPDYTYADPYIAASYIRCELRSSRDIEWDDGDYIWRIRGFGLGVPWVEFEGATASLWSDIDPQYYADPADPAGTGTPPLGGPTPVHHFRLSTPELERPIQLEPLTPQGNPPTQLTSFAPFMRWENVLAATEYYVRVWARNGSSWQLLSARWYNSADICSGGECVAQPSVRYQNGVVYGWEVYPYNITLGPKDTQQQLNIVLRFLLENGLVGRAGPNGEWPLFTFDVTTADVPAPAAPDPQDPTAGPSPTVLSTRTYNFQWWENPVGAETLPLAEWYRFILYDVARDAIIYDEWLARDAVCTLGADPICEYTPPVNMSDGTYWWVLQANNASGGNSPFSEPVVFAVDVADPGAPTQPTLVLPGFSSAEFNACGDPCTDGEYLLDASFPTYYTDNDASYPTATLSIYDGLSTDPQRPVFLWENDANAEYYYLFVEERSTGQTVYQAWYDRESNIVSDPILGGSTPPDTGDLCDANGLCKVVPTTQLGTGEFVWWVRPFNMASSYGPWSNPQYLAIDTALSGLQQPQMIEPVDGGTYSAGTTFRIEWTSANDAVNATHYELDLAGFVGLDASGVFAISDALIDCGGGTCEVAQDVTLPNGTYTWRVRGLRDGNNDGDFEDAEDNVGPWETINFTVGTPGGDAFRVSVNVGDFNDNDCDAPVTFNGITWQPLQNYTSGDYGISDGTSPNLLDPDDSGTGDIEFQGNTLTDGEDGHSLFACRASTTEAELSLTFDLPSTGSSENYLVTLGFVEQLAISAGQRQFNIVIYEGDASGPVNEVVRVDGYDIYAEAGGNSEAIFEAYTVNVGSSFDRLYIVLEDTAADTPVLSAVDIILLD